MIVTVWLSVGHYTETHCLPQNLRQISLFSFLTLVWPLSPTLLFMFSSTWAFSHSNWTCIMYIHPPEALCYSKLTQRLVNVTCILFKDTFIDTISAHTRSDAHLQIENSFSNRLQLADVHHVKISWFSCGFSGSTVYFLQWLSVWCQENTQTILSLQRLSQANCLIYDCKDIGLTSSHNTVYALTLVYIQYPNKAWFILSYYQNLYFQQM